MTDPNWYSFLTDAQAHWLPMFAAHFPWLFWTAPTLMTTSDAGKTYVLGASITPLKIEVYDAIGGRIMQPCAYWDGPGDYVWEGNRIRMPANQSKTFSAGAPYARYIAAPGIIDAATDPTLTPDWARIVLVYHAAGMYARRGGLRDAKPYEELEDKAFYGEPQKGKPGILATLKNQNPFGGAAAYASPSLTGLEYHVATSYSPQ